MSLTDHVPDVPLTALKRTKIIATVGPAIDSYERMRELIRAGANGLRLNFSHGTHEEHAHYIQWVRQASRELDKPVAIIQDLQGPKIRLGDFDGTIEVAEGDTLQLELHADYAKTGHIPTQYDLAQKVKPGELLLLYDGRVRARVTAVGGSVVRARAENTGVLLKRKGINVPDTDFGGDIITAKDRLDLAFGATQDVDYVAQSFVQTADDLHAMRRLMQEHGMNARLIVKFETKLAVEHMDEVVRAADMVMVARGDLAGETSAEIVPIVQRQLVELGLRYSKPTIIATQVLLSMTDAPAPTRAEVSDVATAVLMGADCVMLSEETAAGKYPVEAVQTMKRVIVRNEREPFPKIAWPEQEDRSLAGSIARAVISLAENIRAKVIVAETKSGATPLQIANRRAGIPIIAVTDDVRTAQQLALVYAVKSYVRPAETQASVKLTDWLCQHEALQRGDVIVAVSGNTPGVTGTTDTIKVRVIA